MRVSSGFIDPRTCEREGCSVDKRCSCSVADKKSNVTLIEHEGITPLVRTIAFKALFNAEYI